MEKPYYAHNCEHCVFLGRQNFNVTEKEVKEGIGTYHENFYDVYVCQGDEHISRTTWPIFSGVAVSLRYGSHPGNIVTRDWKILRSDDNSPWFEARKRSMPYANFDGFRFKIQKALDKVSGSR